MPAPDEPEFEVEDAASVAADPHDAVSPDSTNGHLALDIDPELLEAALAAVDKRAQRARPPEPKAVELDLDPERKRPEPPGPRELLLQSRVREQGERLARQDEELRRVVAARTEAEAQLGELRNAARTLRDDFDRFRQRARREREDAERAGEERMLRQVLDTADNVERAWSHAEADPERMLSGLQMIVEQFRTTLRKAGVERIIATPGTPFDPEFHEAVLHVPSEDYAAGTVLDEASAGWRLRGRLLRAARVTVAAGVTLPPPEPPVSPDPFPETEE